MRVVAAVGGNALDDPTGVALGQAVADLADLVADGNELVVTHGNGPQVGDLLLEQRHRQRPPRPLHVLVAMTQAELGYPLQRALTAALHARGQPRTVVTVVTQVVVRRDDPAFSRPSKPIGPRLDAPPSDGATYARTEDGRWRRVVPSPTPVEVVEAPAVAALLDVGVVPICGGGGGIPVVRDGTALRGVDAVVDKDLTSALLAELLGADVLVVLTDVEGVELDHGTDRARLLEELTSGDARELVAAGVAAPGSMGPKLTACARAADAGKLAVVTRLGRAADALAGRAGTRIVAGPPTGRYRPHGAEAGR